MLLSTARAGEAYWKGCSFMRGNNEWMFPVSATPLIREARGDEWRELTEYVESLDEEHEDSLAFTLMMVKICGCLSCQPGGYKLSLGCSTCAFRASANLKGSDNQVLRRYQAAREEVRTFLSERERTN
jgi:hypothetical protein